MKMVARFSTSYAKYLQILKRHFTTGDTKQNQPIRTVNNFCVCRYSDIYAMYMLLLLHEQFFLLFEFSIGDEILHV